MSDNPYQAPAETPEPQSTTTQVNLRSVAILQKLVILCLFLHVVGFAVFTVLAKMNDPILELIFPIALLLLGLATTIIGVMLGIKVYHPVVGVFFGVASFFPCVGLLTLLVINMRATGMLKAAGVRVGIAGADMSTLPGPLNINESQSNPAANRPTALGSPSDQPSDKSPPESGGRFQSGKGPKLPGGFH